MKGFVLWFTGLSGSGKSTLATRVAAELEARGRVVQIVDGDEFRRALSKGLTFSREDRDENVRRIGFVARLLAKAGACAITAAISPFREIRDEQRSKSERFVEVYCRASLDALVLRDPKGLYAKALAGEIKQFTGVDDPYEEPLAPEVVVETDRESVDASVERILAVLETHGLLDPARDDDALTPPWGDAAAEERMDPASLAGSTGDASGIEDFLASGLLAPVTCAMNDKDAAKVARTGRLESGKAFPFVVSANARHAAHPRLASALRSELRDASAGRGRVAGFVLLRDWDRAHEHLARVGLEVLGRMWIVATERAARSIPANVSAHASMTVQRVPNLDESVLASGRAFALTQVIVARNIGFAEIVLDLPERFDTNPGVLCQGRDFLSDLTDAELGVRILASGPVRPGDGRPADTARTQGA